MQSSSLDNFRKPGAGTLGRDEGFDRGAGLPAAKWEGPAGLVVRLSGSKVLLSGIGVGEADVLCVEVFFDAFEPALAAEAGLLDASERSCRIGDNAGV